MQYSHIRPTQPDDDAPQAQYGALCWRWRDDQVQVLLITSRETGRWVIPKGWPVKGLSAPASAAREAWEEAGVRGQVLADCLGQYFYDKVLDRAATLPPAQPCIVAVYPLLVSEMAASFPEQGQRRRKWLHPLTAAGKVAEPGLQTILTQFRPPPPHPPQPKPT
ncbi:MAG: NUDIX hydrolase [Paracoccaceae bacterium]|nr:NUDIX hydrolase [Paracoccaceae bacterium]